MKKLVVAVAFAISTLGAFAQNELGEKALIGNIGYQSNAERFMLGVQGRYVIAENFRLAPDVMFFFPNKKLTGLDVNMNVHYVYNVDEQLSVYPLAGIAMQNNRFSGDVIAGGSKGFTDFGFNLGGGASYDFGSNGFANFELKYIFGDADCMIVSLGYGIRF